MTRALRRLRAGGTDRGTSLVELVVTLSISGVLLLAVGGVFRTSLKGSKAVMSRGSATADARFVADTVARRLRVAIKPSGQASALVSASPSAVSFYASVAPSSTVAAVLPTRVDYTINSTTRCFQESLTPATATTQPDLSVVLSWPAASTRTRCLAFGDVDAAGSGIFTYYATADSAAVALTSTTTTTALDSVRSVMVTLTVRGQAATTANNTTVRTRVTLVNRLADDEAAKRL